MVDNSAIFYLGTAKQAVDFAKTVSNNEDFILSIYDIAAYEDWYFVIGTCDICKHKQNYFIPASGYDRIIEGSECGECGSMSIYPKEESFDEK